MKNESSIMLVAQSVTYLSANDERAFFGWLERVDGFENVKGIWHRAAHSNQSEHR